MNLLALVVLAALAWYSFDSGMTFFAFLLVLAAVLMIVTDGGQSKAHGRRQAEGEEEEEAYGGGSPDQPIVIESPHAPEKGEVRLKVKKWKDRWDDHPNEYLLMHTGIGLTNIMRSILYIFGIQKDEKGKEKD